jgi:hypothetical protein
MATTSPFEIDQTFRLTLEHYGKRISIEQDHSDLHAVELVQVFYRLALAAEWQPKNIIEAFREVADEYE